MIVVVFVLCVMVVVLYLTQGEEAAFCQKEVALLLLLHPTSLMSSSSHSSTTNPLLANGPVSPSKSLSFQARLLPQYHLAPSPPLKEKQLFCVLATFQFHNSACLPHILHFVVLALCKQKRNVVVLFVLFSKKEMKNNTEGEPIVEESDEEKSKEQKDQKWQT